MTDRTPHSPAAEVGILSAVIANGSEAIAACFGHGVTPDSFYVPANRRVFAEVLAMHAEGKPIQIDTVGERLRDRGVLPSIGGWQGFMEMTKPPPLSLELVAHCKEIGALEIRREVIRGSTALTEAARGNPDAMPEMFARLLQTQTQSAAHRTWTTVVSDAAQRAEDVIAGRNTDEQRTLSFGLSDLDRIFHPIRRGELVVVAARPAVGKSSLMRQVAIANSKAGEHVLVESLEVSADDIADSLAGTEAGVNRTDLATAHHCDQQDYLTAIRSLDLENLHVFDCDRSLAAIIARAKAIHATRPIDLLAIDYLGLITDCEATNHGQTKASAIGRVTKALKALAMELDCVVIVLAQLNRQSVTDGNREPRLTDLRDSGDIEQDADRVILIHRPDEDPLTHCAQKDTDDLSDRPRFFVNLIQAKGRNVGTGIASFYFRRAVTRFEQIDRHAPA